MRSTPIYLDRLDHSLKRHGVTLKRHQLLETASYAFGYHHSAEFSAAAKEGMLDAPAAEPVASVSVGGDRLIVLRDPIAGSLYAVDETFLGEVVDDERRERFGNSPYGHLLDVSGAADHPATAWQVDERRPTSDSASVTSIEGFLVLDGDFDVVSRHDGEAAAMDACPMTGRETHDECDRTVVDLAGRRALHYDWGWREVVAEGRDEAEIVMAASLAVASARLKRLRIDHDRTMTLDVPDWRTWERDLKKASHKRQDPISDELLHQFRHAVADVHCKSSSSERSQVEWRQRLYVEKHLGGLLARLDRAEDALRAAGVAPSEIARRPKDDAVERLAAIEAVTSTRGGQEIPNLYEVEATRDGESFHAIYEVGRHELHEDRGRELVAEAFRMNLDDFRDPDGDLWMFDSECDTFEIRPAIYPEAAAIIGDALAKLSVGGDFRFGIPYDHPARIKLLAARDMLVPKPTDRAA